MCICILQKVISRNFLLSEVVGLTCTGRNATKYGVQTKFLKCILKISTFSSENSSSLFSRTATDASGWKVENYRETSNCSKVILMPND